VNASTIPHNFVIADSASRVFIPDLIVSGGQRGADYGALLGAESLGIPTGGYAPRGWCTEFGPLPELGSRFGLIEHESTEYPPRTKANVDMADATILVAHRFSSPGTAMTLDFIIRKRMHPVFDVHFPMMQHLESEHLLTDLRDWLNYHKPSIVNFAGNRESKVRGIEAYTKQLVVRLFS
jgi:hypothetical protein